MAGMDNRTVEQSEVYPGRYAENSPAHLKEAEHLALFPVLLALAIPTC